MRVIFMGTPDFAVGTLDELVLAGHEVVAVVTQPDKPKGRSGALAMSPVKEAALKYNLTVLQPQKAREPEFVEQLKEFNADVIVVVAFGQILPAEIINMPKYGCINVHASLLPKYRGASPIQWAVIDGCEYSGVTTMKMDEGLDTGDILLVKKVKLDEKETGGSLFDRLSSIGAKLLIETLSGVENGSITPVKQNDAESTYVKMLSKSFGKMDFSKDAVTLERLIRGLNPWPSAYTFLNGKMFKIWEADCMAEVDLTDKQKNAEPGTVTDINKDSFIVRCADGALIVKEVQLEGKKRMDSSSFLRGGHLEAETVLG